MELLPQEIVYESDLRNPVRGTWWTPAEDAVLVDSYGTVPNWQLAEWIGRTRNMIIGRAYRLGLKFAMRKDKRLPPNPRRFPDLPEKGCQYGIGDPRSPGFHWCGEKIVPFRAWCAKHLHTVYFVLRKDGE
jgi:GcrA cell cycle regulator